MTNYEMKHAMRHLRGDYRPAILALADGTVFQGQSIGAEGETNGEVVFNTSMTGYQEILTDPSYSRQIVTLTHPHIGNTGVNAEDEESERVHAAGLVIKDLSILASNFRATRPLPTYLEQRGIVAIAGIDTRMLTRIVRERGAQAGAILVGADAERALQLARSFPGLAGMDLARAVTTATAQEWTETTWQLDRGAASMRARQHHVVAYDYGIKANLLRMLAARGCRVTVLPAQTPLATALALGPDGIFLSNGPGDPEPCDYAIETARESMSRGVPTFGVCLGYQILALASGARTVKMKFGHHGANHPVRELDTGRVMITSQNHGFAVDQESLPAHCRATHVSLFDGSLQGFARTDTPAFGFQGHPEASPGPHDLASLFDHFIALMKGAIHA